MADTILSESMISVLEDLQKELCCDADGKGYVSLRGLGRLCGVSSIGSWGKRDRFLTAEIDEHLIECGFEVSAINTGNGIPDLIAAEVIGFYAEEKQNPTAKRYSRALRAVGLRMLIQKAVGWKPIVFTPQQVTQNCILPSPTPWQKRFSKDYYDHLERLTGLKAQGYKRPRRWAALTDELVYGCLPKGVSEALRQCRDDNGGFEKLHQFLSPDGLRIFENHMRQLLSLMLAASSLEDLRRLMQASITRSYQLLLF